MRDLQVPGNMAKMTDAMRLPDGKSLKDILSEAELNELNAYMKSVMGADLTNPMVEMQLGKMSPVAIMTQLQMMQYMRVTPGFNPMALIDSHFQNEAVKAGKSVIGFESVDFQISVLFKGATLERQKEQLFCMVGNPEKTLQTVKDIANAYFAQDLAKLEKVADEDMDGDCGSTPEEKEALIYGRNADWAEKIPAIIGEKPTLFVVGALHLPGERGLLELLKAKGYNVEAVK